MPTKVTFSSEVYDPLNAFDTSPSKAIPRPGTYRLSAKVTFTAGVVDGAGYTVQIWKNGASIAQSIEQAASSGAITAQVVCDDCTDGSGEYEVYVYAEGAGPKTISGSIINTEFSGSFLF